MRGFSRATSEFNKGLVGRENLITTYAHDSLDRLSSFTEGDKTIAYTYDGAHNRLTEKVTVAGNLSDDWLYKYDRHNRLLQRRNLITGAADLYQYDTAGNRISYIKPDVSQNFSYDNRNYLALSKEGTTLLGMYDYNFEGMRVRHEASDRGDVTTFYDGINVLEESIGGEFLRYAYGLDTAPIMMKAAGGNEYYHQVMLGTTAALSDAAGNFKISYRTGPWGNIEEQTGSSQNRMIFTSQEKDFNTALDYFGKRYMDPGPGIFTSQDPWFMAAPERCLQRPIECNLWGYVSNRPSDGADKLGLWSTAAHDYILKGIFKGFPTDIIEEMAVGSAQIDGEFPVHIGAFSIRYWYKFLKTQFEGSAAVHALSSVKTYRVTSKNDSVLGLMGLDKNKYRSFSLSFYSAIYWYLSYGYMQNFIFTPEIVQADSSIEMWGFIYTELIIAKQELCRNRLKAALHIGRSTHPLTDSTSPAHTPNFRPWDPINDLSKHGVWPTSIEKETDVNPGLVNENDAVSVVYSILGIDKHRLKKLLEQ